MTERAPAGREMSSTVDRFYRSPSVSPDKVYCLGAELLPDDAVPLDRDPTPDEVELLQTAGWPFVLLVAR